MGSQLPAARPRRLTAPARLIGRLYRSASESARATAIGSALASMAIYLVMAVILAVKPRGLFPANA